MLHLGKLQPYIILGWEDKYSSLFGAFVSCELKSFVTSVLGANVIKLFTA
jgi:hypothetical protein